MEDQTIEDIDKIENSRDHDENLIDIDPTPSIAPPNAIENDTHVDMQYDINDDQIDVDPEASNGTDAPVHETRGDLQESLVEQPESSLRRPVRERRPSTWYSPNEYALLTDGEEPECYQEAIESELKAEWIKAMNDEMQSLLDNHTFELVKLPTDRKALKNKWIYRVKQIVNSSSPQYKARLVVKGFGQKKGIDFEEIFSPVVKMSSIRVILGLAASHDLEVEQMDVKTAFLHGELDEEIYMEQPEGFVVNGKENYVCRLKKSLYGLKQAARQWYKSLSQSWFNKATKRILLTIVFLCRNFLILILSFYCSMLIIYSL